MAAHDDWTATEKRPVVDAAFRLLGTQGEANEDAVRAATVASMDRWSRRSIEAQLRRISRVFEELGLPEVPSYEPSADLPVTLVPEVVEQAKARGLLPADKPAFDALAIYVSKAALPRLAHGLATRSWGLVQWEPVFRLNPSIRWVILASNFSGGSPNVRLEEFATGTADVDLCAFVGPFTEGQNSNREDEPGQGTVTYPCRFGIEPAAHFESVSLASDGPLGPVVDAIRKSAAHRGVGKPVVTAPLTGGWPGDASGETAQPSSPPTAHFDADGPAKQPFTVTRSEEQLSMSTETRETGRARLRKYVVTEEVTITVPVRKERAVLETEPIPEVDGEEVTASGPADSDELSEPSEDQPEVVLHEEIPVVQMTITPVERVRLNVEQVTDEQTVTEELRKERIEVEGAIDNNAGS